MLQGLPATQQLFLPSSQFNSLLASDLDGSTPPPVGAPNYVTAIGSSSSLAFWKFHADWSTPANSTFTGPTLLPVAAFTEACNGATCIPQAGTSQQLDSLGDRLMYRLAYRNFGDHEALVVNHSVTAGSSTGPRWYEIRVNNGTPSVYQQGTYAPDSNYRWMGSIAMDHAGNMALGYSVSSSNINPQIHYTGRLAGDGLGQMTQGENVLINGTGSQTSGLHRWGDYSSMAIDPSDDCTFWYTQEYLAANGIFNWHTRIGSFKFSSCGSSIVNDFSISANPTSLAAAQGTTATSTINTTVTGTSAQSVTMSASGLPTSTTATFNPPTLNTGASSTMTVNVGSTTVPGTYNVTVTATGASVSHGVVIALTVVNGGSTAIFNGDFETGNLNGWTTSGTTSVSTTDKHAGSYAAQLGSTGVTNGDSTIAQSFIAPVRSRSLGFWYLVHCPDTVTFDWATATLADITAGTNTTILARTCTNDATWRQVTTPITAGHAYTLTLVSHDDNFAGDATYTNFDDVALVIDTAPAGLQYYPLSAPVRLLDTRAGTTGCDTPGTALVTNSTRNEVAIGTCTGIPSSALSVVGNVTSVNPVGGGYITLFPSGVARPTVSNLNYGTGQVINNAFTVGLRASDGAFTIFTPTTTDLVIDISGYYAPPATGGLYFHPLAAPKRLLDTRAGTTGCDTPGTAIGANTTRNEIAIGTCTGIPSSALSVVGNVTSVNPVGGGYITLFPSGVARPTVANLNYGTGQVINNAFTVGLRASDGAFTIFTSTTTDLVIDVSGYYSTLASDANGTGLQYAALASPVRFLDTRSGQTACDAPNAVLTATTTRTELVRTSCTGIPSAALAIVGNVTPVAPLTGGHETLYPAGVSQPTVSNVNYAAGDIINAAFIVGLRASDGAFSIYTSATTNLVIDVSGYFAP